MNYGISIHRSILGIVAATALALPADTFAQCAGGGGRGGMMSMAGGGGRGAGLGTQGGAFMLNGAGMNSAMQMFSMLQQSRILEQMSAMRQQQQQQQAMATGQGRAGLQQFPLNPGAFARPVSDPATTSNSVTTASTVVSSVPTMSRQERLRVAIRKQRQETEARRAAQRAVSRPRSGTIVFNGALAAQSSSR